MPRLSDVYRQVAERDGGLCLFCGRPAVDPAHILPKGRFPELKYDPANIMSTCRECHHITHTPKGRKQAIVLMRELYGYSYEAAGYQEYLE